MIRAGSELVRITAPSKREAENLRIIKEEIRSCGYNTPIVADIHFTPNAALIAATIVEKVRINPGNYADRKKFDYIEYTDASYEQELDRIRERFIPLVKVCKENGAAMRIGTNHRSLSDRILSRYGDTPLGMVESAFVFDHAFFLFLSFIFVYFVSFSVLFFSVLFCSFLFFSFLFPWLTFSLIFFLCVCILFCVPKLLRKCFEN
jgi:4-hydroxy-3-methylbut-2-en-1-yl diphosphate synthase IspG/GcpE